MRLETTSLQECTKIAVSTWSDAMDELGVSGVISGLAQRSGGENFAAFATTAKLMSHPLGQISKEEFGVGVSQLVEASGPGKVLMVDLGGQEISSLGGNAALGCSLRGAAAVVIDGGCRDVEEIKATGLWVASRFITPRTGKRRLKLVAMGKLVTIGNVAVNEGDLIIGDATGIVVVPKAKFAEIRSIAERLALSDAQLTSSLKAGKSFRDSLKAKQNQVSKL